MPSAQGVQQLLLPNGVTYLAKPSRGAAEARFMLAVKVGHLSEREGEAEFPHLIEHLAFYGTEKFSRGDQEAMLQAQGPSSRSAVAYTKDESTEYSITVPASDPGQAARAIALLRDWASAIEFDQAAVEAAMAIVSAEARDTAARASLVRQVWQGVVGGTYADHAGRPLAVGASAATIRALRSFYRRWYHPANLAVIAVGAFDPEQTLAEVSRAFASIPRNPAGERPLPVQVPVEPGLSVTYVRHAGLDPRVFALMKRPRHPPSTLEDARLEQLDDLLSVIIASRVQELVDAEPSVLLATTVAPPWGIPHAHVATLQLAATVVPGQAASAARLLLRELRRLELHGLTLAEWEKTRARLTAALGQSMPPATLSRRQSSLLYGFVHGTAPLPSGDRELNRERLAEVTLEALDQRLRSWLRKGEMHVVLAGSPRDALVEEEELRRIAETAARERLPPRRAPVALGRLMHAPPPPGAIVESRALPAIAGRSWTLENGARVLFKRDAASAKLYLYAFSPGGLAQRNGIPVASASWAADAVLAAGLAEHSAATTAGLSSEHGVQITARVDAYEEGFSAEATAAYAETLLQALHLVMTDPGRDREGFELFRTMQRRRLEQEFSFEDFIATRVWRGDPLHAPPSSHRIDSVAFDDARRFFSQRFGDASDFTFVFVGPVEESQFETLVSRYLATLPGGNRREVAAGPLLERPPGVIEVRATAPWPYAVVHVEFTGQTIGSGEERAMLWTLDRLLREQLMQSVRVERSGSYDISTWHSLSPSPESEYGIGFSFHCEPDRVGELKAAALHVAAELRTEGPPEATLRAVTRGWKAQRFSEHFWLTRLSNALRDGEDPEAVVAVARRTARLTPDEVRIAAQRLLRQEQYVDAVLLPSTVKRPSEH